MIELDTVLFREKAVPVSLQYYIYRNLYVFGPKTDNDLYETFPDYLQGTVRARRIELVRDGKVKPVGSRDGRTLWAVV